jgi:hypothetical protein
VEGEDEAIKPQIIHPVPQTDPKKFQLVIYFEAKKLDDKVKKQIESNMSEIELNQNSY